MNLYRRTFKLITIFLFGFLTVKSQHTVEFDNERFEHLQAKFRLNQKDTSLIKQLIFLAQQNNDQLNAVKYGNAYLNCLDTLYNKKNLSSLDQMVKSTNDPGFNIYLTNSKLVNEIMGKHVAERKVRTILGKEIFDPLLANEKGDPDWNRLEIQMKTKYGNIGLEKLYGVRMLYSHNKRDWLNFSKYYCLYYQTAMERSEYHINNITWPIFENTNDENVLKFALKVSKYNIDTYQSKVPNALDTYANLLYKLGSKDQAIRWMEKAVKLSNNAPEFVETLNRMTLNLPTWPGSTAVNFDNKLNQKQLSQQAKSENKYIVLDFMATWCGPCKEMDKYAYSDKAVGELLNKHFISVKIQMDKTSSDSDYVKSWYADAEKLAKKYEVTGYPTLVFLTPDGKIAKKIVGALGASELVEATKEVLSKSN